MDTSEIQSWCFFQTSHPIKANTIRQYGVWAKTRFQRFIMLPAYSAGPFALIFSSKAHLYSSCITPFLFPLSLPAHCLLLMVHLRVSLKVLSMTFKNLSLLLHPLSSDIQTSLIFQRECPGGVRLAESLKDTEVFSHSQCTL